MPLLGGNLLLQRLVELAGKSKQIDIAVAWARPCDAVEALVASGADKRIVVGLSNHFTDPITLRRLQESATLRVVPYEQPWFNEHQPHDSLERVIWNCRVALLDAFVYEELNRSGTHRSSSTGST